MYEAVWVTITLHYRLYTYTCVCGESRLEHSLQKDTHVHARTHTHALTVKMRGTCNIHTQAQRSITDSQKWIPESILS